MLHASGHNPTGVDVSREQWAGLLAVAQRKRFLVFWDAAYQVGLEGAWDGACQQSRKQLRRLGCCLPLQLVCEAV